MLHDIKRRPVTKIWHEKDFIDWRSRLEDEEIGGIEEYLNARIDEQLESGDERIIASSWLPGAVWRGTPLQMIYEKACRGNPKAAALAYGLFLQSVFIERDDDWVFVRMDPDDGQGAGTFYFQPQD